MRQNIQRLACLLVVLVMITPGAQAAASPSTSRSGIYSEQKRLSALPANLAEPIDNIISVPSEVATCKRRSTR